MSLADKIHAKVDKEIAWQREKPLDSHGPHYGCIWLDYLSERIAAHLRMDVSQVTSLVRADLDSRSRDEVRKLDERPGSRLFIAYMVPR